MSGTERHELANEPLDELLLALEARRASAVVHIETPSSRGELSISHGVLRGAVFDSQVGAAAIAAVLRATEGNYRVHSIADTALFSGTLFQPGGMRARSEPPPASGLNLKQVVVDNLAKPRSPLMLQRIESCTSLAPPETGALGERILRFLKTPHTGADVVQTLIEPAPDIIRTIRALLGAGALRFVSAQPPPDSPSVIVASRRVLISDNPSPSPRTDRSPVPPLQSRAAHPPASEPFEPAPSAVTRPQGESWDEAPSARRRLGSTLPSNLTKSPEVRHAVDAAFDRAAFDRARAPSSAPLSSSAFGGSTVISGTAPAFIRNLPSSPAESSSAKEAPPAPEVVSSTRFEAETLEQLERLNDAIESSEGRNAPLASPEALDPEGTHEERQTTYPRVGRYEVIARLRSGGMGSVYLCRAVGSAGFRRLFAMKVLKETDLGGEAGLVDFFREARVLAGMHHPNVVGVFDVGTAAEPYLVLDYVEGGSLHELLSASPHERNPALVVSIFIDALAGLHAAHLATDSQGKSLQLVHGDVTPHNLLVGTDGACRVADFGIAKTREAEATTIRGKAGYVAPEVLLEGKVDRRADIFSIGVALYSALTGVEPFAASSTEETLHNVLTKEAEPPSRVGLKPPPSFDYICMRAMEKDPEARFSSAEEMLVDLRRVAARQDLMASPSEIAGWVTTALGPLLETRKRLARGEEVRESAASDFPPGRAVEAPLPPGFQKSIDQVRAFDSGPNSSSHPERTVALDDALQAMTPKDRTKPLTIAFVVLCLVALGLAALRSGSTPTEAESVPPRPSPVAPAPGQPDAESGDVVELPAIEPARQNERE